MSVTCDDSHLCFGKQPESVHRESHLCFGKRYRSQLEPLEAHAVVSVLEDAVNQLAILSKMLPEEPEAGEERHPKFKDVDARFGKPPPSPRVFPELAGRRPADIDALLKIQRDRLFAEVILDEVLDELRDKGSFTSLRTSLDWQGAMAADESKLLEEYEGGQQRQQELAQQLSDDLKNMLDQKVFWDGKADLLTSKLHDTFLTGGLMISYANVWELNRREQQGMILGRKEDGLHEAFQLIQDPEGPNEERVHAEIMRFLAKNTEELKKDLEHWTDLYDAEMMQRETENIQLRNSLELQKETHRELIEEECHRKEIMEQAEILRAENEGKQKIISSVVAIQAWWRGVSFRAGIKTGKSKKGKKKKRGKKRSKSRGKLKKK